MIRAFKVLPAERHANVLLSECPWFNPWTTSLDTVAASPYIDFEARFRR